jgi:hypothetical protein
MGGALFQWIGGLLGQCQGLLNRPPRG